MSNTNASGATPAASDFGAIDYAALHNRVNPTGFRDYLREVIASGEVWEGFSVRTVMSLAVPFGLMLVIAPIVGSMFSSVAALSVLAPVVAVVAGLALLVRWGLSWMREWRRRYRLEAFAHSNGFMYLVRGGESDYPGSLFQLGERRVSNDNVLSRTGRFFDIGNYRYTTGSSDETEEHQWSYLAFRLDRTLPHMVLNAKSGTGSRGGGSLPVSFRRDQILRLEGDFNEYFTLYCPREYERDALYVFTPDLMALLIDNAANYNVEVIDDWMFVYSPQALDAEQPSTWQRMFQIIRTVGTKTLRQTEHYRDEKAVPAGTPVAQSFAASANTVAPQGRRLRSGVNVVGIAVAAAIGGWVLWNMFLQ